LHRFVGQVFAVVLGGLIAYCAALAVRPEVELALGLVAWASGEATRVIGAATMVLAIVWTGYAQFAMGSSWRIGIPEKATALRMEGPCRATRSFSACLPSWRGSLFGRPVR
jgi:hypothetical protein